MNNITNIFKGSAVLVLFLALGTGTIYALTGPHASDVQTVESWPASAELQQAEDFYQGVDLNQSGRISCFDCDLQIMFDRETGDLLYTGVIAQQSTITPTATAPLPTETSVPTATPLSPTATPENTPVPTIIPTDEPTSTPQATATNTAVPMPTEVGNGYIFPNGTFKLMLIGDSITKGQSEASSYRYHLWNLLQNAGFSNVDFVGPTQQGPGNNGSGWDRHHASFNGWQPSKFLDAMVNGEGAIPGNWPPSFDPDGIAIHYNTNGHMIGHCNDIQSPDGDYLAIINNFRAHNPNVVVFVSKIAAHNHDPAAVTCFNDELELMAARESTPDSPIIVVDNWTGFIQSEHTSDGNHLNVPGAIMMANNWFNAITGGQQGQPVPEVTPTATSQPVDLPTSTPIPTATLEPSVNVDPSKCIVGGEGNLFNIAGIGQGWWISTDEYPENAYDGKHPIIATVSESPADLDHNLTWCFIPQYTGTHYVEMTYQARTNQEGEVWFQINDGVVTSVRQGDDPEVKVRRVGRQWNGWADDGEWYPAGTRIDFEVTQGVPVKVSFYPKLARFRIYAVRLVWVDQPAEPGEPCGGSPYPSVELQPCPDFIYPPPQQGA